MITAKRQKDSGQATLVILPPASPDSTALPDTTARPGFFGIRPALDTAVIGDTVKFVAQRADSTVDRWTVSDTTIARLVAHQRGWAKVLARARGSVTIKATRGTDTGQAKLVVVQPSSPDSTGGTETWEAIDLDLVDGCAGQARDINDASTIVGQLLICTIGKSAGFIWKAGVTKKLRGPSDLTADAIGPSGIIAGYATPYPWQLVVWNSPDAEPRRLGGHDLHTIIGVNARGDILTTTENPPNFSRGVLWRNDVPIDLGDLNDGTASQPSTLASAWNSSAQIVGKSQVRLVSHTDGSAPEPVFHAFIWENGAMRDLGVLGSHPCQHVATPTECSWSEAVGINAQGVVVGTANGGVHYSRAFMWKDGVMQGLGAYEGHSTRAIAINDRGQILGAMGGAGTYDTLFFYEHGQVQIIVPLEGLYDKPILGSDGEVVGAMKVAAENQAHVFIWKAGQLTDLGQGIPLAINSHDEIVGTRITNGNSQPTLWRRKPR